MDRTTSERPRIDTGESRLLRLYARTGWRRVPSLLGTIAVLVGFVLGPGVVAVPVLRYFGGGAQEFLITGAIWIGVGVIGTGIGIAVASREWKPAAEWLKDPGSAVSVQDAWRAAVFGPIHAIAWGALAIALLGMPPCLIYWAAVFDLGPWEILGACGGGLTALAALFATSLAVVELLLKPIVSEMSAALPPDWRAPRSLWRVGPKIMVAFLILSLSTGIVGGALIPESASSAARLALTVGATLAVALLVAGPLMLLAANAILEPLRELRAGTGRVSRGDLRTPISVSTADEFGEVASSFNLMLAGLRERAELAERNVELLKEVRASRSRIIAASDTERRRVERNIHDGAQQRLVALALELRHVLVKAGAAVTTDDPPDLALANRRLTKALAQVSEDIEAANESLAGALEELRELARGLHPQILTTDGLAPAIEQLAQRSSLPVRVVAAGERYPDAVESTAYFVVSEALANVGKYAQASQAEVSVEQRNGALHVEVADDGVGGADPDSGSGLSGLSDRVAALDGSLSVDSPPGEGTRVRVELPATLSAEVQY